jgi:serine/threonine protein kinase
VELSRRWLVRARELEGEGGGPVPSSRRSGPQVARAAGDVIAGKYALRGLLGRGGMGSVWQAKNLTLGTDVAVKLILPSLATTEAGERLFREARAAALLDHPSIVRSPRAPRPFPRPRRRP